MTKKVNFLGVEFDVIDNQMIADAEADEKHHHDYMVIRCVDTNPNAGSLSLRTRRRRTPCEVCHEICWIDPLSYESTAHLNHTIICQMCMLKKVERKGDA